MSSRTGPVTWCDHENSTGVKFLRALHSALRSRNRMGARNRTGPASSGLAMNNQPNHCITGSLWEENQPMRRFPNEEFVKVFLCHEVIRWWIALKKGVYFDPLLHNERAQGGRFKNTYELLNQRALKFSYVNKIHIFQCMGKIFCVEFQRYPLKFHTKCLTHTLKDMIFMQFWNFKSS